MPETFSQLDLQRFDINIGVPDTDKPFLSNPWVRTAVEKIATNISLLPLFVADKKEAKGGNNERTLNDFCSRTLIPLNTKIKNNSKWNKVLKRPHPLLTTSDFLSLIITYSLLPPGDSFILCLNSSGKPIESASEIPAMMIPIWGKHVSAKIKPSVESNLTIFEGWEYGNQTYKDFQLRQFRLTINPYDQLRGIDPISSALSQLKFDNASSEFSEKFIQNAAILEKGVKADKITIKFNYFIKNKLLRFIKVY